MKENIGNPLPDKDLKRLRCWVWVFLVFCLAAALGAAFFGIYDRFNPELAYKQAKRIAKDPMALTRHVRINGVDLWIPVPYFMSGHIPHETHKKAVLLTVSYPEFEPLKERPGKLHKEGRWYGRHVRYLIQDRSVMKDVKGMHEHFTSFLDATLLVDRPYGLEHYTSPPESKINRGELYLDREHGALVGLVNCGEDSGTNPQCTYRLWHSEFLYDIDFDKDILPQWRDIKNKTLALTKEFRQKPTYTAPSTD